MASRRSSSTAPRRAQSTRPSPCPTPGPTCGYTPMPHTRPHPAQRGGAARAEWGGPRPSLAVLVFFMKKQGWLRWLAVAGWRWCAGAGCGWQALMLLWRWHSSGSLMLWLAGYAWLWQAVAGWCDGAQWRCADGWHPSLLRSNRGYRRGHRYISRTTSTARRTVTVVRSQPLPAPGILSEHAAGALRQRPAHGSATRTLPTAQVLPVMWSWGWGRGRPPSPRHPLGFQGITK